MLTFLSDNEALTARKSADCTIPSKRSRYSKITVTEAVQQSHKSDTATN